MARRGRRRGRGGPTGGRRGKAAKVVRGVILLFALVGILGGYASRYLDFGRGGAGGGETGAPSVAGDSIRVPVTRVIDGDTVVVRIDGREERVRYIGMNTPETHHPRIGREPFGPEATEANRRLVGGRTVRLAFDVERRDDYERLLAYVYLPDGTFVNAELVERGYAEVMTVPPNVRHADLFRRLERKARTRHAGLWGAE